MKLDRTPDRRALLKGVAAGVAGGAALLAAPAALRAQTRRLKLSHYLPPQHQINAELTRWAKEVEKATDGALVIDVFPAGQMGPPPRQYDLARTGVADLAYVFTAFNPGRFPRMDLLSLPFRLAAPDGAGLPAADCSWMVTTMKDSFDGDFKGVEMLYAMTGASLGFFMKDRLIETPSDLEGLRVRPNSKIISDQIEAMGASPARVGPVELADAIAKGVVDGAVFNFEGGKAFQLDQSVRKVSTFGFAAAAFALVAGEKSMNALPAELSQAIRDAAGPDLARHVGGLYDQAEAAGRDYMAAQGVEIVDLRDEKADAFRQALAPVGEAQIAATEEMGVEVAPILDRLEALKAQV